MSGTTLVSRMISAYAVLLGACGLAMLFAPEIVTEVPAGGAVLIQLIGAAFIGFAVGTWLVRNSPMGGIYGRAVVAANQAFAFIGTLVLLGGLSSETSVFYGVLTAILTAGAMLFGWLLFRGPN